ncbi:hypothetical protein L593_11920 [Salinarchaeum sp. Harcht-Bsk1]|uniref:DUF7545 family protein n=1 Tax=Salinarchaeum sp. Harcht-Bsk1 TaxID=1333523 RepID=UPI00034232E6|nr:hypothetical protein [Salinarchaeum sp. Harcht-Bsk1]AGN02327.1 hypothetical protein L593_11920 [Salinarchaeum sp. Harcht-Bsk1]
MADTYTLTIESDSEHEDETVEVPQGAIDALAQDDDSPTVMAGDLVMLGLAQQLHANVFHSEQAPSEQIQQANEDLDELFEDRFGMTFEEMAGHEH